MGYSGVDTSLSSFHGFIKKIVLHEAGHTMDLADQPVTGTSCSGQTAGESVMNYICNSSTGKNDSENYIPTDLTSCDNNSIQY
jgi:hypothetical protein